MLTLSLGRKTCYHPHMAKAMQGTMGSCAVMGCPDPYTNTAVLSALIVPVLGTHSF